MSISILFNFENKIEYILFIEKFSLENMFSQEYHIIYIF